MLLETGQVVAIEPDCLWVETLSRSTCASCQTKQICGQSALAKWGAVPARSRVSLAGKDVTHVKLGDRVTIGIPEDVIARGSILIYLLPLVIMIIAAYLAQGQHWGDLFVALSALLGLATGALIVKFWSKQLNFQTRLQPIWVDAKTDSSTIQACKLE